MGKVVRAHVKEIEKFQLKRARRGSILSCDRKSILSDTQSEVWRTLDNQWIEVAFWCRVSDAVLLLNRPKYHDFVVLDTRRSSDTSANGYGNLPSNMFHGYDVCRVRICAIRYPEGMSGASSIKYSRCPKVILIDQQFRELPTYREQIRWRL